MGRVLHFEICADDVPRAKLFYEQVFGWTITQRDEAYWEIKTGDPTQDPHASIGGIDGGLVKRDGQPPLHDSPVTAYVCTIDVDDLAVSIHKVIEHGGNLIVDKREVPGTGWVCYCKDTEGNMFSMLQVSEAPDAEKVQAT
jgi:uncharacterized protein